MWPTENQEQIKSIRTEAIEYDDIFKNILPVFVECIYVLYISHSNGAGSSLTILTVNW